MSHFGLKARRAGNGGGGGVLAEGQRVPFPPARVHGAALYAPPVKPRAKPRPSRAFGVFYSSGNTYRAYGILLNL